MKQNKFDFFEDFWKGMDKNVQAQLRYNLFRQERQQEYELQRKLDAMEQRITENVMKNISIRLEDEALKQLRNMLNGLAQ